MTTSQAFIQGLLAAQVLGSRETVALYNSSCDKTNKSQHKVSADDEEFETILSRMNRSLQLADLEIKKAFIPWEEKQYYGIVNAAEDEASKLATKYKVPEIIFFNRLSREILDETADVEVFDKDDPTTLGIPLTNAQNLASDLGPDVHLRVSDAAHLIQTLHRDKWLKVIKKPTVPTVVTFGVRSVLELPNARNWALERSMRAANSRRERPTRVQEDDEIIPV